MAARTGYSGIKVFSATTAQRRNALGEEMTEWLRAHPTVKPVATDVRQSSDDAYHCVTIIVYYNEAPAA